MLQPKKWAQRYLSDGASSSPFSESHNCPLKPYILRLCIQDCLCDALSVDRGEALVGWYCTATMLIVV